MKKFVFLFLLSGVLGVHVSFAQESQHAPKQPSALAGTDSPETLREHVPVLPAVKAKFWNIDPALGCGMKDFGNGLYALSDNGWQSAFLVTDAGVIVFDGLCLAKTSYTCKMNDLAQSSIQIFPVQFLP